MLLLCSLISDGYDDMKKWKIIDMKKWKIIFRYKTFLFLTLWAILCAVGFVLEKKAVWAVSVYIFTIVFVFFRDYRRCIQPDVHERFISRIWQDLYLWLLPVSRIIIVFIQQ